MTTEAPRALPAGACPEPEQLAAYIDGRLAADARTPIERHLIECPDCRDIVGATAASAGNIGAPRRARKWWIEAAVGLAAAAAILLFVRTRVPAADGTELHRLAAAVGTARLIEPRLSGGFEYGPAPAILRGRDRPKVPLEVEAAALRAKKHVEGRTDPASATARGAADLLLGDMNASIAALEQAAQRGPRAERFSDLAAAYLVRAAVLGGTADADRALSNADRAVQLDAQLPEALFNRALALEAAGRRADAAAAWRAYLARDSDSGWAREARSHLDAR